MELINKWVTGGDGCRLFSRGNRPREGVTCLLISGITALKEQIVELTVVSNIPKKESRT